MPPRLSKKEKKAALAAAAAAGGAPPEQDDDAGDVASPAAAAANAGADGASTVDPETSSTVGASSVAPGGAHDRHAQSKLAAASRTTTGLLVSEKRSKDIKIASFSINLYGRVLVEDTGLELSWGNRCE